MFTPLSSRNRTRYSQFVTGDREPVRVTVDGFPISAEEEVEHEGVRARGVFNFIRTV